MIAYDKMIAEVHDRARRIETKLSHLCEKMDIDLRVKPIQIVIKNNSYSAILPGRDVTVSAVKKALEDSGCDPFISGGVQLFDGSDVPHRTFIGTIYFQA